MTGHLAGWLVRNLWLGAQGRLVFQRPCAQPEAGALLAAAAAADLVRRLHSQPTQVRTPEGKPEVKNGLPGRSIRAPMARALQRPRANPGLVPAQANQRTSSPVCVGQGLTASSTVHCAPLPAPVSGQHIRLWFLGTLPVTASLHADLAGRSLGGGGTGLLPPC